MEFCMIRIMAGTMVLTVTSCANISQKGSESAHQKEIFKSWVLSRCLSYTFQDKNQKQDALNTASAYLEQSTLSVEQLLSAEPLIKQYLARDYQGSIKGTFNTKKCIDLFNSRELEDLYNKLDK